MGRLESVLSPQPPGAGRVQDWTWPPPAVSYFGAATAGIYGRTQYRSVSNYVQFNNNATGTGASIAPAVYQGVPVYSLLAAVATVPGTGESVRFSFNFGLPTPSPALGVAGITNGAGVDTRHVFRCWANLAFVGTPVSDQDLGLEMMLPANANVTSIIHDNSPGFGLIKRASGAISIVVNGPGGVAFHDATLPVGFDPSVLHAYEFRLTAPTATNPAQLVALVDNAAVFSDNWAVGTDLPVYNAALGQFQIELLNYGGNNLAMHCQQFKMVTSTTLQDTL